MKTSSPTLVILARASTQSRTRRLLAIGLAAATAAVVPAPLTAQPSAPRVVLGAPLSVDSLGAAQGVEWREGKLWIYGDRDVGVAREYDVRGDTALAYTGRELRLTVGGRDSIAHPTGLTVAPGLGTWLGNTVNRQGALARLDWARLLATRTLDSALTHVVADDAAVQGSRPEFVRLGGRPLLASSDYGEAGNEVRLYDPTRLAAAARTSEPGVVAARFRCGPWVQSLLWVEERGLLVLVQNITEGLGWRLTFVDLAESVRRGDAVVRGAVDLPPRDELEGFHLVSPTRGFLVSSSRRQNVVPVTLVWPNDR